MKPGYKPLRSLAASLLTAWVGGLAALPANAESLAQALEQAWARQPHSAALAARREAAQASAELAAGLTPGPARLSLAHLNDRINSNRGKQEWEIELAAPLWLPGQQAAQAAAAASASAEIDTRNAAQRLELAGELRAAWWKLAGARQADELARERLSSERALEKDVLRRYRVGDLARVDANLARAATLAAQAESLLAEAAARQAELAWRNLTGMAAPNRMDPEALPDQQDQVAEHPRLLALAGALQTSKARLGVARENRREAPELAVRMLRERGDSGETNGHAIGIKLSIPFASKPRLRLASSSEHAEVLRLEAEQMQIRQRLQAELEQVRFELEMAEQQSGLAHTRHQLAADNLALAEKAFRLGESDLAALLRARATAFATEAALKRQKLTRSETVSQLRQVLGLMP